MDAGAQLINRDHTVWWDNYTYLPDETRAIGVLTSEQIATLAQYRVHQSNLRNHSNVYP